VPRAAGRCNWRCEDNQPPLLALPRIRVRVQSTWFPLIDRNPQTFVPNIFRARGEDYHSATQRIYRSREHSSHIELPVAPH